MKNKRTGLLVIAGIIVFFYCGMTTAAEVQQVETTGTIGFTGTYKPKGTPDPTPPESIVKPSIRPDLTLPQTNERDDSWLIWLGLFLVSVVGTIWKRKQKQTNH